MNKRYFGFVAAAALAVATVASPVAAKPLPEVEICHFAGHEAPTFPGPLVDGQRTQLHGDYVLLPINVDHWLPNLLAFVYCDTANGAVPAGQGGQIIKVNANSLDGHDVELKERVALWAALAS